MGQVVGKVSDIFRCNLRAIQTGGSKANTILAADEVWLVDTTNSLTNSLSGNCDAYIVGDGSTKASALELKSVIEGGKAKNIAYDNLQSGLSADNLQDAMDDIFLISKSENFFDFDASESTNPSSSNYSVTKDVINETIILKTKKRIASDSVKGGFTNPNLEDNVVYRYRFDYTNQIEGAYLSINGDNSMVLAVGNGSITFDATKSSVWVALPINTPSGRAVIFRNIKIINPAENVSIKDAINEQGTLIAENNENIDKLKKDVISIPMIISFNDMIEGVGIISPSTHDWRNDSNSTYRHLYFARTADMKAISVQGNGTNGAYISFLQTYNYEGTPSGTPDYCEGYSAPIQFLPNHVKDDIVLIPDDCNFIVIDKRSNISLLPSSVFIGYDIKQVVQYEDNVNSAHRVLMEVGHILTSSGLNSNQSYDATSSNGYAFSSTIGEFERWRNVGMIKVKPNSDYVINFDKGEICWIYLYDKARTLITSTEYGRIEDVSEVTFNTNGAEYLRFMILHKSTNFPNSPEYAAFPEPKVTISGNFVKGFKINKLNRQNEICDVFNFPVWIENTYCCNDTTTNFQDNGEWHIDFGRIRFPENYDPDGEPVRMIIYCHGGNPRYNPVYNGDSNYGYVAGNFNTNAHINPTLFLAEGYAVMDIDGVFAIFNEKEESNGARPNSLPQTAHCYQAAYDYIIKNYNIKIDGILLGGISFGGSKALQIITHSHIPVIAAALESPYVQETVFVNNIYRGIIAKSVGIIGLSDTGNLTDEDIEILKEDYNEVITGTTDGYDNYFYRKYNYGKLLRALPVLGSCKISVDDFFAVTHIDGIGDISLQNNESVNFPKYVVPKWAARFSVPIKMWCCTADQTSVPYRNGQMLYAVGTNGGSDMELRMITGGSHTPSVGNGILSISNYVTKYGQIFDSVPLVYAEMIKYWRRYVQS